jgi:protoheme IX farnesyltransferase
MFAIASFLQLTKPSIVLLVLVTALAALGAQGLLFEEPIQALWIVLAIGMSAGSANAFNQFIDRDIDAEMERTRNRRPIPLGKISPRDAFIFALTLGLISTLYLGVQWNWLSAGLAAFTIFYYTVIYTIWLKRSHYYNIVIGGAAGSAGPLIAWAAADGQISAYAWILFALIFMWTPAHFWALALAIKDEYKKVSVPMLPVVHGDRRTRKEIVLYTWSLLPLSLTPVFFSMTTWFYGLSAIMLWIWYIAETYRRLKMADKRSYLKLFYFSILYLFLLFCAVGVDGALRFF